MVLERVTEEHEYEMISNPPYNGGRKYIQFVVLQEQMTPVERMEEFASAAATPDGTRSAIRKLCVSAGNTY